LNQYLTCLEECLVYLNAITVGEAVPLARFGGQVHSIFRTACNLRLDDGSLITLLSAGQADLPQGIRLDTQPDFTFDTQDLRAEQRVICESGIVRFASSGLSIDLRKAHVWRVDLTDLRVDLSRPETQRAWGVAWQELQGHRSGLGCDDAVSLSGQRASQAIGALVEATWRLDAQAAGAAAERLIGLGSGLTPSGDDFLVGYLAGLWSMSDEVLPRCEFVSALGAGVSDWLDRTNDISRAFLLHAVHGRASGLLIALVQVIGDGEGIDVVSEVTQAAIRLGHTSGSDGVAGLLLGLAAWQDSLLTGESISVYLKSI
jgi:hypothetical protein